VTFGGVMCVRGDREGVVKEDIMDDVFFSLVFCVEVVGVYLLYRNLIAEYLCCGWFDVYGISVSVRVDFLNIEIFMPARVFVDGYV